MELFLLMKYYIEHKSRIVIKAINQLFEQCQLLLFDPQMLQCLWNPWSSWKHLDFVERSVETTDQEQPPSMHDYSM